MLANVIDFPWGFAVVKCVGMWGVLMLVHTFLLLHLSSWKPLSIKNLEQLSH